jgi:hypothetical protein
MFGSRLPRFSRDSQKALSTKIWKERAWNWRRGKLIYWPVSRIIRPRHDATQGLFSTEMQGTSVNKHIL